MDDTQLCPGIMTGCTLFGEPPISTNTLISNFTMSTEPNISQPPSLHIAVLGVGSIGSTFAFQLAQTGHHDVTVIARPGSARFKQLQLDNGIVTFKNERAEVRVTDKLDEAIPYDLIIVALLVHQVDAVLPALQRSAAKCMLFMFNNFEPERLQDALGAERCSFGMPFVQASIDQMGRLNAKIGVGGQKSKINLQGWVDVFMASGLPAVFEPDMLLWLRCHVPLCIAFESISVAGQRRGGGASWDEAVVMARGVKESFTLIQRLGYRLYPLEKSMLNASPVWMVASMLWFISRVTSFRELLATGIGECRALVDVLVTAADRADPPVASAKILATRPSDES